MFGMFGKKKYTNVDVEITRSKRTYLSREDIAAIRAQDEVIRFMGHDPYDQWKREIEIEQESTDRKASEKYSAALERYRKAKNNMDSYDPEVEVVDYSAGMFLKYEDIELPIRFIESIKVTKTGGKPTKSPDFYLGPSRKCWIYARHEKGIADYPWDDERPLSYVKTYSVLENPAVIDIFMSSGRNEQITCLEPQVEILLDRLNKAWKEGIPSG